MRLLLTALLLLTGCSYIRPRPQPVIQVRVDTVTVTKEVAPPLATGDTVEVCLANGMPAQVLVTQKGDTLIGDARIHLKDARPLLTFAGVYAADTDWFAQSDTLRFERRLYRRTGLPAKRACDELKQVGSYQGVYVYADVTASPKLPVIAVPVRPGMFQAYAVTTSSNTKPRIRR